VAISPLQKRFRPLPWNVRKTSHPSLFCLGLTFLAPFLGGSNHLGRRRALLLAQDYCYCSFAEHSLGRFQTSRLSLLSLSLTAFLPACGRRSGARSCETRRGLTGTIRRSVAHIPGVLLLLLNCRGPTTRWPAIGLTGRRRGWPLFGASIVGLRGALFFTICSSFINGIPFWPPRSRNGFFSNQNHTSNVWVWRHPDLRAGDERFIKRRNWWLAGPLSLICWG